MSTISIHPSVDKGVRPGAANFAGGPLTCHCTKHEVTITIKGNVAHNHACGCTKCWKPQGAMFSVVAVVAKANLMATANGHKLKDVCRRTSVAHRYSGLERECVGVGISARSTDETWYT